MGSCCPCGSQPEGTSRLIDILGPRPGPPGSPPVVRRKFATNKVRTSKYTLVPFFPDFFLWKMLWEQFQRKANVYFLLAGALQLVPGLSPTGRFTTLGTLMAVLLFGMIKAGIEDIWRHARDHEVNCRKARVVRSPNDSEFQQVLYKEIQVGDVILISNQEDENGVIRNDLPCDVMLLSSSEPAGIAYVETSNLDGETNLKLKRALDLTHVSPNSLLKDPAAAVRHHYAHIPLETEMPNSSLYTFTGTIERDGEKCNVTSDQMLYRGCRIRKVKWVIGVVVFTGKETKIVMNARDSPHKVSMMERRVNMLLVVVLVLLLLLAFFSMLGTIFSEPERAQMWYLGPQPSNKALEAFLSFLTFLILFNNLIPISLYVSLEFIKFFQGRMMEQDLCMYHEAKDMPASARSTAINEELGQVSHVFSDKTGTLTKNVMSFLKFCVNGVSYGEGTTEIGRAAMKRVGIDFVDPRPPEYITGDAQFYDERVQDGAWLALEDASLIRDLFTLLGVCHTVVVDNGRYEAESPDEEALVKAAKLFDFSFVHRTADTITIQSAFGVQEEFEVLEMVEFNSDRKRMSMLVRHKECSSGTEYVKLMMKGADSVMWPLLAPGQDEMVAETAEVLGGYGHEGLRTLVLAQRVVEEAEWRPWVDAMRSARRIFGDEKIKAQKLEKLAAQMECGLSLVGATAIEDKLQDAVPATIESLRKAGVKVWMLTGDKLETAINIGYACALMDDTMRRVQLDSSQSPAEILHRLQQEIEMCRQQKRKRNDRNNIANSKPLSPLDRDDEEGEDLGIVVDGQSLAGILIDQPTGATEAFTELSSYCSSVICCRVSPKQKADVVQLIRAQNTDEVTLAIGDGANDVPMIQAAHVGVGISGMEGQQAANTSDYAIGQFRYLQRLMLVHGRANYQRLGLVIRYSFHKNTILMVTQFWFVLFNQFTGMSLYEKWILASFNVVFTAIPILVVGVFNRDILDTNNCEKYPTLYHYGLNNEALNLLNFAQWVGNAIFQSAVVTLIILLGWNHDIGKSGITLGVDGIGLVAYVSIVCVVTAKLALHITSFTWMEFVSMGLSVVSLFIFIMVYSSFSPTISTGVYDAIGNIGFQLGPWLYFIIVIVLSILRDALWRYYEFNICPIKKLPIAKRVQLKDSTDSKASIRLPTILKKMDHEHGRGAEKGKLGNIFAETSRVEQLSFTQGMMMQFCDEELEDEFVSRHLGSLYRYKLGVFICAIATTVLVAYSAYELLALYKKKDIPQATLSSAELELGCWALFSASAWFALVILMCTKIRNHIHAFMAILMLVACSGMSIAHFVAADTKDPDTHPVTLAVILLGILAVVRPPLVHALHYNLIAVACYGIWFRVFMVKQWSLGGFILRYLELILVAVVGFFTLTVSESFLRKVFVAHKEVEEASKVAKVEERRSNLLLRNTLPTAVVTEMQTNRKSLSDFSVRHEASLLNSDIVGFTDFSSTKSPSIVVEMLNKMFTKFDNLCLELGVEKLKTIGDAYICGSGLPYPNPDHQIRILTMGLMMIDATEDLNSEGTTSLQRLNIRIRVGCATGMVQAGVVGLQKVSYDIFGKSAEESEHMEQTGRPSRLQASRAMYEATKDKFEYDIVLNSDRDHNWPRTAAELGVTQFFVRRPEALEELSAAVRDMGCDSSLVRTVSQRHTEKSKDIYRFFFEDDEVERTKQIKLFKNFTGTVHWCTLSFTEGFWAEKLFRSYLSHIAYNRFLWEMVSATFLFLSSALLTTLSVDNQSDGPHPIVIMIFIVGALHLITLVAIVIHNFRCRNKHEDEDDTKHGNEVYDESDVTSLALDMSNNDFSASQRRAMDPDRDPEKTSPWKDYQSPAKPETSPVEPKPGARQKRRRILISLWALTSILFAAAMPLLMMFVIFARGGSYTHVVFVILASSIFILSFMHVRIIVKLISSAFHFGIITAAYIYLYTERQFNQTKFAGDFLGVLLCYLLSILSAITNERTIRQSFAAGKRVAYRNAEVMSAVSLSNKLLNNLLPASIVGRMKAAPNEEIVDEVKDASVMFIYFDGLTDPESVDDGRVSDEKADIATYDMVNSLNVFIFIVDALCVIHGVEKIKTKPFLVVSGCPEEDPHHARRLLILARDILAQDFPRSHSNRKLKIKCGIHSGRVTAGVLGTNKFLFDIFGDTVNMASRTTNHAEYGTIQVSPETKAQLDGEFDFIGPVRKTLKGKGEKELWTVALQCPGLLAIPVAHPSRASVEEPTKCGSSLNKPHYSSLPADPDSSASLRTRRDSESRYKQDGINNLIPGQVPPSLLDEVSDIQM